MNFEFIRCLRYAKRACMEMLPLGKSFNPQLKQTRIFIDHFFNGFSYEDLAVMFDASIQEISNTYSHAIERLLRLLEYLDSATFIGTSFFPQGGTLLFSHNWYTFTFPLTG